MSSNTIIDNPPFICYTLGKIPAWVSVRFAVTRYGVHIMLY